MSTCELGMKPVPVSVIWNGGAVSVAEEGFRLVKVGVGLTVKKASATETPPPGTGVPTVTTEGRPKGALATATSLSRTVMRSVLPSTNWVARGVPFQNASELCTKLSPLRVITRPVVPAVAWLGESANSAGAGFCGPPGGAGANDATAAFGASTPRMQESTPPQSPDQPANTEPG